MEFCLPTWQPCRNRVAKPQKERNIPSLNGDIICKSMNDLPFRNLHKWLLMLVWQTLPNGVWINVVIVLDLLFLFKKSVLLNIQMEQKQYFQSEVQHADLRGSCVRNSTHLPLLWFSLLKKIVLIWMKSSIEPLTIHRCSHYFWKICTYT